MIKGIQCKSRTRVFHDIDDLDAISELLQDKDNVIWLDLTDPSEQELQHVAAEFNFHPLAVEDASHSHQRPKVDTYDHFFFVIFYSVLLDEKAYNLIIHELKIFVGENYLVTVHRHSIKALEEAEQRWRRNQEHLDQGVGILLYSLLDSIVDNYFPVVDALVDQAEEMEDRIFEGHNRSTTFTAELLELKKRFLQLRRIAGPERDVLNVLTNRDSPVFNEKNIVYFRDVFDHIIRVADTIDLYRDQLSSTMDANLTVASNELNRVMRTLTTASIVLMSDALIASIYGMNFENMPELKLPYGYFGALALMLFISTALLLFFKRRHWL